jgi:hypothetical protein
VTLEAELEQIAGAAGAHARDGEELAAVMPAEPAPGVRVYLTAYRAGDELGYLVLDSGGAPVSDRRLVRDAVSVIALAERAEEASAAVAADAIAGTFEATAGALAPTGRRPRPRAPSPTPPGRWRRRRRACGSRRPPTSTGWRRPPPR